MIVIVNGIRYTWSELAEIYRICWRASGRKGVWRRRLNFQETARVQTVVDAAYARQIRSNNHR